MSEPRQIVRSSNMKIAYFDIETNYVGKYEYPDQRLFQDWKNHLITVVGVFLVGRDGDEFVQLVDEEVSKKNLMHVLRGVRKLVTYNGRSIPDNIKRRVGFDFPVIAARLGVVLDREFEHTDLVPECWKRDLYGGQKKVEEALGLRRKLPGRDGGWAQETWRKYLETRKRKYLDELLLYNKEDVFMLREIERLLARF